MKPRPLLLLILGMIPLAAALVRPAPAIDGLRIDVARVAGPEWSAGDVRIGILPGPPPRMTLSVGAPALPPPLDDVTAFDAVCEDWEYAGGRVACRRGSARLVSARFGALRAEAAFEYLPATRSARFELDGLELGGGEVSLSGALSPDGWTLRARVRNGAFSDASGRHAGEALDVDLDLSGTPAGRGWRVDGDVTVHRGSLFLDPVCAEIRDAPLRLRFGADWDPQGNTVSIPALRFTQPGVMSGTAGIRWPDPSVALALDVEDLGRVYAGYVQPCVFGTALDELEAAGRLSVRLHWTPDGLGDLSARFDEVFVDDARQRFGVYALGGNLSWADGGAARRSRLAWQGGHLFGIALGAGEVALRASGRDFVLAGPVELPVLDGALQVETFVLRQAGRPDMRWTLDGVLRPVSMEAVSQALGWPPMGGQVSAVVPEVNYRDGRMSVNGVVLTRVFDGDILIHDLVIERPFAEQPVLTADVEIRPLDLAELTRAFSFGDIEGRVAGEIRDLVLVNWRPVAFRARFATPPGDRSRHRISQRAVDNLSSLGGARVAGTLSSTFLRFFETFTYERLGLSCVLRNGICRMDGVAQGDGGYYIVKGGLVPPVINVMGYNREVDWDVLVERLKGAVQTGGSVIQ